MAGKNCARGQDNVVLHFAKELSFTSELLEQTDPAGRLGLNNSFSSWLVSGLAIQLLSMWIILPVIALWRFDIFPATRVRDPKPQL